MTTVTNERQRLLIAGVVQGVGFRPFVYRLAQEHRLTGWVANTSGGVEIEVQGNAKQLRLFSQSLRQQRPPQSRINSLQSSRLPLEQESEFVIRESIVSPEASGSLLPDLAPCDECLRELFEPTDRRYRYPFINCTQCGPRYSICEGMPYDRRNTTMRHFDLCESCAREYRDPLHRRFHAEPNACPACGPRLQLCDSRGNCLAFDDDALQQAVTDLTAGKIIALKGVGGFQLLADASNQSTVAQLRKRKLRPHKPFALLFPDIAMMREYCALSEQEERLLCAPQRPIVLVPRKKQRQQTLSEWVAPQNPDLGVMLPASPLHHLLLHVLRRPIIATSGNLSGEPICTENNDALARLGKIADRFLMHNRRISRPLDDSVIRVMGGKPVILRRARGYAPLPQVLPESAPVSGDIFALGADLKASVALARGSQVFISPYIGDLESPAALDVFEQAIADLESTCQAPLIQVLCDAHPGYISRHWAKKRGIATVPVQHHIAHFFSCMGEHGHRRSALGICWDGTGYGSDGTIWGGEFLHWDGRAHVRRIASLKSFALPGGEQAVRHPRRCAAGLLYELFGKRALHLPLIRDRFRLTELRNLGRMLETGLNSPRSTSAGRLFDAVSVLLDLCDEVTFEGQAAMAVEYAARGARSHRCYPFELVHGKEHWELDWGPTITGLIKDGSSGLTIAERADRFHNTLVDMMVTVAENAGEEYVFLSGGVFQNRRLTETAVTQLRKRGFRVFFHGNVPPNDGGIALGQIYYARCMAAHGVLSEKGGSVCV